MALGAGCTPITVEEMLLLIQKQLREGGAPTSSIPGAGLGSDAFLSLWPDQLHLKNPVGKRFVVIRPQRFPVWQSVVQGAGESYAGLFTGSLGFNHVFSTVVFSQITGSDPEMRNPNALVEDTIGIISICMKVASSLQMWYPLDADGDALLREPARLLDGGLQIKPVNVGDAWWAQASMDWEAKFTVKLPDPAATAI